MPAGTLVIDSAATFSNAILMSAGPKDKFGSPGVQETSADGTPKWVAQVAVTFAQVGTMAPVSEVLTVTVTGHTNPAEAVAPGTVVAFDGLRAGVSTPEKRDNGTVRGGRLWFSAAGLRPAHGSMRQVKEAS